MPSVAKFEHERLELASLLASGIFNRAPSLSQLLTYICQRHFEGEANQIKEYNIAVEALGRPSDFDQKRDSIVRVEAHRLRKRLKDYYTGAGSSRPIRVEIPPGQYAPRFIVQEQLARTLPDGFLARPVEARSAEVAMRSLETVEQPRFEYSAVQARIKKTKPLLVFCASLTLVLIALAVVVGLWYTRASAQSWSGNSTLVIRDEPAPLGEEIRILAGSQKGYTDRFGRIWERDRFYDGGSASTTPNHPVFGTRDGKLYETRREGAFRYDIPLKSGSYELRLHFAETLYGESNIAGGGEASRLFNISTNGKSLLETIDVIADAGPNAADIRVFKDIHPDADGYLHLDFKPVVNVAFLNAIEIAPGTPRRLRPIRILARDQAYVDKNGHTWSPDRFFLGGQLVVRPNLVSGTTDPEIYRGERFGNLTYAIPVAAGHYTAVLHFAETWFGPDKPQKGGRGSRVFDLLCNGVALVRGLDIYKEAGGDDRALDRTFHGLEPNPQGKLVFSLIPIRNYGSINAIEVLDEAAAGGPRSSRNGS